MAIMYPPELSPVFRAIPGRRAEVFVYDRLRQLPDDYHIIHSVRWEVDASHGRTERGEADFILAHPQLGWLVMEVKGGLVKYVPEEGLLSHSPSGTVRDKAKCAWDQSENAMHTLTTALHSRSGWRHSRVNRTHVVALPDTKLTPDAELPSMFERTLLLDAPTWDDPQASIERAFAASASEEDEPLGEDRLQVLLKYATGLLDTQPGFSWAMHLWYVDRLSEQQVALLDTLSAWPRAKIAGCAGSGKTLLAIRKANSLAAEGKSVLLTCFNKRLGEHLAEHVEPGVTATHLHGYALQLLKAAGLEPNVPERRSDGENRYYRHVLPALMIEAIKRLPLRFDALVVDEGQDFGVYEWYAMTELLRDFKRSHLYVFYDGDQDLFTPNDSGLNSVARELIGGYPLRLRHNYRSTPAIHRVAAALGSEPSTAGKSGPSVPVIYAEYGGRNELHKLVADTLHAWRAEDGLRFDEVLILTGRSPGREGRLAPGTELAGYTLTDADDPRPSEVTVATIQSYKGLERRAVILAYLDDSAKPDLRTVLHVGCTRAQERLAIFCDKAMDAEIRGLLTAAVEPLDSDSAG